jgi:hypothetical protein
MSERNSEQEKERIISDAELLKGGAGINEVSHGEISSISPTKEQLDSIHEEMETDLEYKKAYREAYQAEREKAKGVPSYELSRHQTENLKHYLVEELGVLELYLE